MQKNENSSFEKKENMPKPEVVYGLDTDKDRVKNTIKKLPWFAKQGYKREFIKLPVGITEESTEEEIDSAVNAEYAEEQYEEFKLFIEKRWAEFSKNFEELKTATSLELKDNYIIVLTKYGMGGSYDAEKGKAIINMSSGDKERVIGIIFHEIAHTTIEHLIRKYQIKHWHKERLVDLMMDKFFPGLTHKQNIKEDVVVVDEAFDNFFPDFEAIVREIK